MPPIILVLDDEAAIAELARSLLEEEGYRVILAPNGREGLRLLREERPDLVISDVMMPLMDGRAFARTMHADPAHAHLPLILMSAAGEGIVDGVAAHGLPRQTFRPGNAHRISDRAATEGHRRP